MLSLIFAVGYRNREFKMRGRFARSKFLLHASLAAALLKFTTIKPIDVENNELFNSLTSLYPTESRLYLLYKCS